MGPSASFNLSFAVKDWFFDRPRVLAAVDGATRHYLASSGALVQTIAQRSMRYRSPRSLSYAPAGSPPKAVRNHPWIRQWTLFGLDEARRSVVVGPVRLPGVRAQLTVPALQEYGGTAVLRNPRRRRRPLRVGDVAVIRLAGRGGRGTVRVAPGRMGKVVTGARAGVPVVFARLRTGAQVERAEGLEEALWGPRVYRATYAARPYMIPALLRAAPTLPRIWAEAFGRAARRAG